ncbi:MAG: preprotein translocase subunit SecA, partial [Eggerthellaceae bacterium]|nr:preprotein translocase subunit SecA [Eggerthellaceae bacterium]
AFGQRDPLVEYKNEAYSAFERLTASMYDDYLRTLLRLQIAAKPDAGAAPLPEQADPLERKMSYSSPEEALGTSGTAAARRAASSAAGAAGAPPRPAPAKPQTYVKDKDDPFANVGRNDPCPCGSGKKYKKCHGADQ